MGWIKDDKASQLDQLTRQGDEALTYFRDLKDRLEETHLRDELSRAIIGQEELLERLRRCRRLHGDLPQAGDPERGHLQALLTEARSVLDAEEHERAVVDALLRTAARLREGVETALAVEGLGSEEAEVLESYRAAAAELEATLERA